MSGSGSLGVYSLDQLKAEVARREEELKKAAEVKRLANMVWIKCPTCCGSGMSFSALDAGNVTCYSCKGYRKIQAEKVE